MGGRKRKEGEVWAGERENRQACRYLAQYAVLSVGQKASFCPAPVRFAALYVWLFIDQLESCRSENRALFRVSRRVCESSCSGAVW